MTSSNSTSETNTKGTRKPTMVSRGWMVTINNPIIPGDAYLAQWFADKTIVFGCGQKERAPDTGTPHLQLYIVTAPNPSNKNGYTMKWLKEHIHSTAHYDKRMGTHDEAKDYCTLPEYKGKKKDVLAGPWTVGEWTSRHELTPGEKAKGGAVNASKILSVKRKIDEGARDAELYEEHFGEMLRYGKAFERYRVAMLDKSRSWQTKAMVLYGDAGTGKTRRAWHVAKNIFGDDVYPLQLEGDTVWWDGYSGQKCVVIDEFYGQMKIGYLLKLLDRYPLLVQTKGGMTPFLAEMIIFTSNEHPDQWYGKHAGDDLAASTPKGKIPQKVLDALKRRLSGKLGSTLEMKEVVKNDDDDNLEDFGEEWKKLSAIADEMAAAPTPPQSPAPERRGAIDLTAEDEDLPDEADDVEGDDIEGDGYIDYDPDADYDHGYMQSQMLAPYEEEEQAIAEALAATSGSSIPVGVTDTPPTTVASRPPALKRQLPLSSGQRTSFGLMAPPKAPASEFKKVKQVPGQAKLIINRVIMADADDDVDDK